MRLTFDRGTLLFADLRLPPGLDVTQIPGVLWDERVGAPRAPARLCYPLASELRRRGVPLADMPRPTLAPPSEFRPFELRPYQEAALAAWRQAGRRGVVVAADRQRQDAARAGRHRGHPDARASAWRRRARCCDQWAAALAAVWDGPIGRFGDGERVVGPVTVATFAGAYRHMAALGDKFGLLDRRRGAPLRRRRARRGAGDVDRAAAPRPDRHAARARRARPTGWPRSSARWSSSGRSAIWRGATWRRSSGSPGTWRSTPTSGASTTRSGPSTARRGAPSRATTSGASWEDFLHDAARTDEGRRGLAAWRRARRLLAFPRRKREALALLLGHHRGAADAGLRGRQPDGLRGRARAPGHAAHLRHRPRRAGGRRWRASAPATLRALVSAQVLNEGIDVPDAEVGIVVAGRMGEREHVQRVGRLLRPGDGKRALVYELVVERSSECRQAERRGERLALRTRSSA